TCAEIVDLRTLAETAPAIPLETLLPQVLRAAGILDWVTRMPESAQGHADLMRIFAEVSEFVSAHRDFKAAAGFHGASAQVFLGWLEARREERDFDRHPDPGQSAGQGVEIVTWHASKGREWPITVVVGLDKKIGEKPGSLRAEFTDFSDLNAILERALLIWTPDLPIKEKKDAFIEDRRSASEADARRLLYVALTRGRDRLILEWPDFALKKLGESDGPANHAEMLVLEAGMQPEAGTLKVGGFSFPARTLMCSAEAPGLLEGSHVQEASERLAFGELRSMFKTEQTVWRVRPSLIVQEDPLPDVQTRIVPLDVPPQAVSLVASASERGTALHKAMRVLLLRPDLRPRLSAATGFDEATLDLLQAQADALKKWLTAEGYTQIECEVPIQKREASGAEFNGIIDLLAAGDGKRLILDHKSGGGSFAGYFAQLDAYRGVLAEQVEAIKPDVAIHWIDRATVETKDASSQVD
ncbi:MAG: PD-(D/E)XK nuclease family protein, partial [Marivita lacus]|nr:PD-(D/E)XK nuclease family protein [Marivita lacus]